MLIDSYTLMAALPTMAPTDHTNGHDPAAVAVAATTAAMAAASHDDEYEDKEAEAASTREFLHYSLGVHEETAIRDYQLEQVDGKCISITLAFFCHAYADVEALSSPIDSLMEFQQDEVVREALDKGVDLRNYSWHIEAELRKKEAENIAAVAHQAEETSALFNQIKACDQSLATMEAM
jgi:hypothetical protein